MYRYPDYIEFIKSEIKTIRHLHNDAQVRSNLTDLYPALSTCVSSYPTDSKKFNHYLQIHGFKFSCDFTITIDNKPRKIIVEAKVLSGFSDVSYLLGICEGDNAPYNLIRKFHFDYLHNNSSSKPIYHLQYGGTQSPYLANLNIAVNHLYDWLSEPRITFMPINLALIFDMIFREFESDFTRPIIARSEWRDLVKANEELILSPYYRQINSFFTGQHSSSNLFCEFCRE